MAGQPRRIFVSFAQLDTVLIRRFADLIRPEASDAFFDFEVAHLANQKEVLRRQIGQCDLIMAVIGSG